MPPPSPPPAWAKPIIAAWARGHITNDDLAKSGITVYVAEFPVDPKPGDKCRWGFVCRRPVGSKAPIDARTILKKQQQQRKLGTTARALPPWLMSKRSKK